ncbi:MAG: class II aldolase/adducin family protein [Sulfurifustaceae bacterium]
MTAHNAVAPEVEGVTKFDLVYAASPALPDAVLAPLIAWRTVLWRLGVIGQDPARYGGVGFGNVSQRLAPFTRARPRFAITGTQTGAEPVLDARHFAIVTACDPRRNRVVAEGPVPPSSESLTHGMIYALDPAIRFVFHGHSPEIWRGAERLRLPCTAPDVAYGTPAMAQEMRRLWRAGALRRHHVLVMRGHEDGVIVFGRTAEQAGRALVRTLALALQRLPA